MKTLIQILPSLDHSGGGVERGTLDIAKHSTEKGYKSVIISSGGDMAEKYRHKGVIHYKVPLQKKGMLGYIRARRLFNNILKDIKPSIIHVRSRWPAFCLNNLVKNKIPLITTFHGTYSGNNNFLKKKYNSLMTQGDRVIAISKFINRHIQNHFPDCKERIRLINRGIDTNYFDINSVSQIRKENFLRSFGVLENKHIVLLPGRLTSWKGHNVAIDAAKIISEKYSNIDFVILFVGSEQGKKKYLKKLEYKIRKYNLNQKIFLLGSQSDMPSIYSLSDVVLSTSIVAEAFGRVSAEASAMSKPVIASNLGGSRDIIEHKKTGWLIKHNEPNILAEMIVKIINKPQSEKDLIGKEARRKIIEEFSLSQMLNKTMEVYDEVQKEYFNN